MEGLERAREAVAEARWDEVAGFLGADDSSVEAYELLAEARWWLGDPDGATAAWAQACHRAVTSGQPAVAARLAAWLAREYGLLGNHQVASGWMSRARRLGARDEASAGWVALAQAVCLDDPIERGRWADEALARARTGGDADLEISALSQSGLSRIRRGDIGDGLAAFDEALALATGGEATRLRTVGEVCCDLVRATELTGDIQRLSQWMEVVKDFVDRHGYPTVVGFCSTCCAQVATLEADFALAEQQLRAAVVGLHESGHGTRCVPPAAKLADLLVLQGRFEEAAFLVADDESAESEVARARLALARGDASVAVNCATRAARRIAGDVLVKVAAQALLVDAWIAAGDVESARQAATALSATAELAGSPRALARSAVSRGRLALTARDEDAAIACFEEALDHVAGVRGSIESADAHLALARLHESRDSLVAVAEARLALGAYEAVGARREMDQATALLRRRGDRSRVGAKGLEPLTEREWEVLRLVGQGLTNAEIGGRLFISTKTAGNHVSNILSKLNLRSRVEAAMYATVHPHRH